MEGLKVHQPKGIRGCIYRRISSVLSCYLDVSNILLEVYHPFESVCPVGRSICHFLNKREGSYTSKLHPFGNLVNRCVFGNFPRGVR